MAGNRSLIIGGGPAGLTAAYELRRLGSEAVVYEMDDQVGGISRTACYEGYRFDIGGHRFFTKVPAVQEMWEELLSDELLQRPRLSRIYYNDRFFDYPLKPLNALRGLGPVEAVRIAASYARATAFPTRTERTFEDWVVNRFGRRLFEIFFKTYTEKVWGIPCSEIGADWAAQRIKNLDLVAALKNALVGQSRTNSNGDVVTSLIEQFAYPRLGPGMMWERCRDVLAADGVPTKLEHEVVAVHREGTHVTGLTVRHDGVEERVEGDHVISSMPIRTLLNVLEPAPPAEVLDAANRLRYRDFLTVVLLVKREDVFPDNWIYIHSPKVKLGRIQNFKNWSPDMVPDPANTSLGLEYFVQEGDEVWTMSDEDLIALGTRECDILGLVRSEEVFGGTVIRMPKAYPVYDGEYQSALDTIKGYVETFENLLLVGRNGLHRYNNQDHSMVTAMYAARRIHGQDYDIWNVNTESDYHEALDRKSAVAGDRLVPQRLTNDVSADVIRNVFARYDPIALGTAAAATTGLTLFLMTVILLVRGGDPVGPTLSLLGHYLVGYEVSWPGAYLGLVEAGVAGFAFGFVLALVINVVVSAHENSFRRELEVMRTVE